MKVKCNVIRKVLRFFLYACMIVSFMHMKASAQSDSLFLHNGLPLAVNIIRIDAFTIGYQLQGSAIDRAISRYAVSHISYKNGKTEFVSAKVEVNGEEDWDKVILLEDKSEIAGLQRKSDVIGHNAFLSLHTPNTANSKAIINLKREAAKLHCPFVLLNFDRESSLLPLLHGFGGTQTMKGGMAYSY